MTAKQLSEATGIPEKTIYRIETGEVLDPKSSSLLALSRGLGCTADQLLYDGEMFMEANGLQRAFITLANLPEDMQEMLVTMIHKVSMATSFEEQLSEAFRDGKYTKTARVIAEEPESVAGDSPR